MSKEREFLKKLRYATHLENDLRKELEELLAQPEQEPKFNFDLERMKAAIESPISDVTVDDLAKHVKQEPVAWKVIDETNDGAFSFSEVKPMERYYKDYVVIPLYTAPPKRELLGDDEIWQALASEQIPDYKAMAFIKGVKWAEQQHDIGVGDE